MISNTIKQMRDFNEAQRRRSESGEGAIKCRFHRICPGNLKAYRGPGDAVIIRCDRCRFVHGPKFLTDAQKGA